MWNLKTKALIYWYTGIYLAHKEENKYLNSKEFWTDFARMAKNKDLDMSPRNIQGLLIGLWQAKNGLVRPYSLNERYWRRLKWRIKARLSQISTK